MYLIMIHLMDHDVMRQILPPKKISMWNQPSAYIKTSLNGLTLLTSNCWPSTSSFTKILSNFIE